MTGKIKAAAMALGPYGLALGAAGAAVFKVSESTFKAQAVFDNLSINIDKAKNSTLGLVGEFDLAKEANAAVQLGVVKNAQQFADLSAAAVKLGAAVGQEAAPSINSLVGALGRNSPLLLDNLGVSLKVSEAQSIYAKQLGKTTGQLTETQRALAFKTIGLQKVLEKSKSVKLETEGFTGTIKKLGVAVSDLSNKGLANYEKKQITLLQAVRQMDAETRVLIKTMHTYGADQKAVNEALKDMGVEAKTSAQLLQALGSVQREVLAGKRAEENRRKAEAFREKQAEATNQEIQGLKQIQKDRRWEAEMLEARGGQQKEINALLAQASLIDAEILRSKGSFVAAGHLELELLQKQEKALSLIQAREEARSGNARAAKKEAEATSRAISAEGGTGAAVGYRDPITGNVVDYEKDREKRNEVIQERVAKTQEFYEKVNVLKENSLQLDIERAKRRLEIAEAEGLPLDATMAAERAKNAELSLIEFREENADNALERAQARDQKEAHFHQKRLNRAREERKVVNEVKKAYVEFSADTGRALMSASIAAIQASDNKGKAFLIEVAGVAKSLSIEHALRGASELATGIALTATLNPMASGHYTAAGIHFGKAAAFGAIGIGTGALGGGGTGISSGGGSSMGGGYHPRSGGGTRTPRSGPPTGTDSPIPGSPGSGQPTPRSGRRPGGAGSSSVQNITINATGAIDEDTVEKILVGFSKHEQTHGSLNV